MIKFDVLLSTYNGEKYLREQLDSILVQSDYVSKIIIRDDGSSDKSVEIIKSYQIRYYELIYFIDDGSGNLGVKESFYYLTKFATSEFMAFCDQDDFWLPEKLAVLSKFIEDRNLTLCKTPLLIHSDLTIVDDKLNGLYDSFINYIGVNGNNDNVADLLIRNSVTGCAAVINAPLAKLAVTYKDLFKFHDECAAVIASLFRGLYFIEEPLILYRQHGNNVVGAPRKNKRKYKIKIRYPWKDLAQKSASLLNIRNMQHDSLIRLEKLIELSAMTPLRKMIKIRTILKELQITEINFSKLKFCFLNKK